MSIYACSDFHGFRSLYGEVKNEYQYEFVKRTVF